MEKNEPLPIQYNDDACMGLKTGDLKRFIKFDALDI